MTRCGAQSLNSYSYANDNPIVKSDPNGRTAATAGVDVSAGTITGSLGVNFDQYGVDYYYGWGSALGAHAGVNAGMTTDTLSHTDTITTSAFGSLGVVYGGEVSYGVTDYRNTKKPWEQSMAMTGGLNFGDAAGVRTVVSGKIITWGSSQSSSYPTVAQVLAQHSTISAPSNSWSLPSTVSVGGATYYRNYSGLLSTTAAQSTPQVMPGTTNSGGSSGSAATQYGFQLHAIIPH